jgi:hypothetical protein
MSGGFEISKEAVDLITQGLRGAVGELKGFASAEDAEMGAGFTGLAMTGMEAGDGGLADDFSDFCDRWEWGVRALVQNASDLANRAGLAAGTLWEEDQYLQGTFKVVANAAIGNPDLTDEQVEKESWGQALSPKAYEPDFSAHSREQAGKDIADTWKQTGDQLENHGILGTFNHHLPGAQSDDGDDAGGDGGGDG